MANTLVNIISSLSGGGAGTPGGVVDNTPILNGLLAAGPGGAVLGPGTFLFNSTTNLFPAGYTLIGSGPGVTILRFEGTGPLFQLNNSVNLENMTIDGVTYTANRKGIYWNDKAGIRVRNVEFKNLKLGANWENNLSVGFKASYLEGCMAENCETGYFADIRGEYVTLNNCYAYNCIKGVYSLAGNTKMVSGSYSGNNYGIHLGPGDNHAHSLIDGVTANHNSVNGLFVDAVTLGMNIVNSTFFSAPVLIQNSQKVLFCENFVDANIVLSGSTGCKVRNNNMNGFTVTGTAGNDVGNN